MLRPVRAGGGWKRINYSNGEQLDVTTSGKNNHPGNTPAKRPAYLGMPGAARRVERTPSGYLATLSDEAGNIIENVGLFAEVGKALEALRAAEAAANV